MDDLSTEIEDLKEMNKQLSNSLNKIIEYITNKNSETQSPNAVRGKFSRRFIDNILSSNLIKITKSVIKNLCFIFVSLLSYWKKD